MLLRFAAMLISFHEIGVVRAGQVYQHLFGSLLEGPHLRAEPRLRQVERAMASRETAVISG